MSVTYSYDFTRDLQILESDLYNAVNDEITEIRRELNSFMRQYPLPTVLCDKYFPGKFHGKVLELLAPVYGVEYIRNVDINGKDFVKFGPFLDDAINKAKKQIEMLEKSKELRKNIVAKVDPIAVTELTFAD
jgi:hypothetical protein